MKTEPQKDLHPCAGMAENSEITDFSAPLPLHDDTPEHPADMPRHANEAATLESMKSIAHYYSQELTARDMLDVLRNAMYQDREGEAVLFTQAQVLDALFHRMMIKALSNIDENGKAERDYIHDLRLMLALRAQKQCRATVEAMNAIRKNRDEPKDFRDYL